MRDERGQATVEYAGVVLLVALVLGGALAAAAGGIGERVVAAVRTGLCIAGGDVCRPADAAAAGLAPCVTRERFRRQDTAIDVALVRFGGQGEWQLALRSDGSATVTRLSGADGGAGLGIGLSFSPAHVEAQATAMLVARYRGGKQWRFADERSATAFLEAASRDGKVSAARQPDVTWHATGAGVASEVALAVAQLATAGLTASAGSVLGLRTEGERRTLTVELDRDEPHLFGSLPGMPSGAPASVLAELTWERGTPRELVLRTGGGNAEYAARLDLRVPANRVATEAALRGSPRALTARLAADGVLERDVYALTQNRKGFDVAGRLGVALGLSHHRVTGQKRLVDAVTWVRGGPPQRRFDCLGKDG